MQIYADHTSELQRPSPTVSSQHVSDPHSGIADNRETAHVQRKLQALADSNAHVRQLKALELQTAAGFYASGNAPVIQRVKIRGGGNLDGTVQYSTRTNNGSESAYLMMAKNIRLNPNKHALAGGNGPEVDPPGWTQLQNLGLTNSAPHYKRMHLLNGELGGHGNKTENLAPGSSDLNTAHYTQIESDLQAYVLGGGVITSYDVFATYRNKGLPRFSNGISNTYKHTLLSFHCQYTLDDGTSVAKEIFEGNRTAAAWPSN